jgi:hypothetical protein
VVAPGWLALLLLLAHSQLESEVQQVSDQVHAEEGEGTACLPRQHQHQHRPPRLRFPPSGTLGPHRPRGLDGPPRSECLVVRRKVRRPCRSHLFNSSRRCQQGSHFYRETGSKMAEVARVPVRRLDPCSAALGLRPLARIQPTTNATNLLARSSRLQRASNTQQATAVVTVAKQRTHHRSAPGISSRLAQTRTGEPRRQLRFLLRSSLLEYMPAAETSAVVVALPLLLHRRRLASSTGLMAFRQMQQAR